MATAEHNKIQGTEPLSCNDRLASLYVSVTPQQSVIVHFTFQLYQTTLTATCLIPRQVAARVCPTFLRRNTATKRWCPHGLDCKTLKHSLGYKVVRVFCWGRTDALNPVCVDLRSSMTPLISERLHAPRATMQLTQYVLIWHSGNSVGWGSCNYIGLSQADWVRSGLSIRSGQTEQWLQQCKEWRRPWDIRPWNDAASFWESDLRTKGTPRISWWLSWIQLFSEQLQWRRQLWLWATNWAACALSKVSLVKRLLYHWKSMNLCFQVWLGDHVWHSRIQHLSHSHCLSW